MLALVYEYRHLLGKCTAGVGVTVAEIERLTRLEAMFEPGEDDRRARDGRRFRREPVHLDGVVRGGALHDAVTISELTLGGLELMLQYTQYFYPDRDIAARGRVPVDPTNPDGPTRSDIASIGLREAERVPDAAGLYEHSIGVVELGATYKF